MTHSYPPVKQHTSVATGYFLVIRALQRATRNPDRTTIGSLAPICPPLLTTMVACLILGSLLLQENCRSRIFLVTVKKCSSTFNTSRYLILRIAVNVESYLECTNLYNLVSSFGDQELTTVITKWITHAIL